MTRGPAYATLFAALVLVSTAGPFLEMANMDAYAIVFLRMALAAPLFLGWAAITGTLRVPAGMGRAIVLGGVLVAVHFLLWVKAFDLTNYASNLLLLVAQPVIAAFLGGLIGERMDRSMGVSIALAIAGLAIIAGGDFALGPRALLGDGLCILAGFAITLFFVVTRHARREMAMQSFMGWTLGVGALTALPVVIISGAPVVDYPAESWKWVALLVVATTMGGHGLMNVVARHVRLFTVNVVIVLEPPIGILLGSWLFPVEVTMLQVGGGVLLSVAVVVALLPEWRKMKEAKPATVSS